MTLDDAERTEVSDLLYALYERMTASQAIVVAALDGHAIGGGAQLAIAADLRVGRPGHDDPPGRPGARAGRRRRALPSLVGRGRALDLCLTMRPVHADEALAIGLVDRLADDAPAAALELAGALAELARPGRRRARQAGGVGGVGAASRRSRSSARATARRGRARCGATDGEPQRPLDRSPASARSISSRVGDVAGPRRVTAIAAAMLARRTLSSSVAPRARFAHSTPVCASPAPLLSTARAGMPAT